MQFATISLNLETNLLFEFDKNPYSLFNLENDQSLSEIRPTQFFNNIGTAAQNKSGLKLFRNEVSQFIARKRCKLFLIE